MWLLGYKKDFRELLGGADAYLLVHAFASKYEINVADMHSKKRCQKADHVIGRPAIFRSGSDAYLEFMAMGLAYGVFRCARFAQNVDDKHIAIPSEKSIAGAVAGHPLIILPMPATLTPREPIRIVLATLNARFIHASLGLRYLLANMSRHGSERLRQSTVLREYTLQTSAQAVVDDLIQTLQCDRDNPSAAAPVVGLGVYIWNIAQTTEVVRLLRQRMPRARIVLGGPEVSHEQDQLEIVGMADHVISGWGDVSFPRLCKALFNEEGAADIPPQKLISGVQPALHEIALPYGEYSADDLKNRVLYVEASRGCPFKCEFCLSALDKTAWAFDLYEFLQQMELLYQSGARTFKFVDRTFNLKMENSIRILRFFLDKLQSAPGEPMFVHFELVPDHLPENLKSLIAQFPEGVLQFEVGIQTFNEEVQKRISRRQDNAKSEANLRWLAEKTHAHLHADLIFGLPGESWESFAEGFDRLYGLGPHEIQLGLLKRLRGTPLAKRSLQGAVAQWDMQYESDPPYTVLHTDSVTNAEVKRFTRIARYWDLIANSGRFTTTLALVLNSGSAGKHFSSFADFVDWQTLRHEATAGISPEMLVDALYEYLGTTKGIAEEIVRLSLLKDYVESGARGAPLCLKNHLPKRPDPQPGKSMRANARQQRHKVAP